MDGRTDRNGARGQVRGTAVQGQDELGAVLKGAVEEPAHGLQPGPGVRGRLDGDLQDHAK